MKYYFIIHSFIAFAHTPNPRVLTQTVLHAGELCDFADGQPLTEKWEIIHSFELDEAVYTVLSGLEDIDHTITKLS